MSSMLVQPMSPTVQDPACGIRRLAAAATRSRAAIPAIIRSGAVAAALVAFAVPALAQSAAPQLFRVVGPKDEVMIGLTAAEFDSLGGIPGVERLARKLVADGQVTAWQYVVGRGPDGATRYVATRRIAILRSDTLRIEPYSATLPVSPPPTQ